MATDPFLICLASGVAAFLLINLALDVLIFVTTIATKAVIFRMVYKICRKKEMSILKSLKITWVLLFTKPKKAPSGWRN